ncbi:MAG: SAM-dependent chlorinase/fluorinase [Acidimicrobiia bacterium]
MAKYEVISFLSDMGTNDESVGVCKAIIYQQAPNVNIFDITHDIAPFDVRAGALALTRAIQFLPNGIVLAAIDPGSPRDQRYIAVEMEQGILIGPDNGILAPAAQLIGEPKRVIHISNPEFQIEAPGKVFAARDILAPAAGVLAAGTDIGELGPVVPLEQLVPGMLQLSRHDEGGAFLGEVWSVDRFGNTQINITPEELQSKNVNIGDTVSVRVNNNDYMAKYVERYADLAISQLGILIDSTGMISIVKNLDNAARELDLKEGKAVAILPQGSTITGRDIPAEEYVSNQNSDADSGMQSVPVQNPVQPLAQPPVQTQMPPQAPVNPIPQVPQNPPVQNVENFGSMAPVQNNETQNSSIQIGADPFAREPQSQTQAGQPQVPIAPPAWAQPSPVAPQQSETPQVSSDPFAREPQAQQQPQAPAPDPTLTYAQNPTPQAPVQPVPPQQPVPDTPASYFPPPVEQPQAPAPDPTPTYTQNPTPDKETVPGSGLPENVFDLFKGPAEEENTGDTNPNNQ